MTGTQSPPILTLEEGHRWLDRRVQYEFTTSRNIGGLVATLGEGTFNYFPGYLACLAVIMKNRVAPFGLDSAGGSGII